MGHERIGGVFWSLEKPHRRNPTFTLDRQVETRSFNHFAIPVSVAAVARVRDAIMDLFAAEIGKKFTEEAKLAWKAYFKTLYRNH